MKFKSDCFILAYYKSDEDTFLFEIDSKWYPRRCKEEACVGSLRAKSSITLFFTLSDNAALCAKFNEYANLIGLSAKASVEKLVHGSALDKECDIIALANTLNPLEREAAAILIRTLRRNPRLLEKEADIKYIINCDIYFSSSERLQATISNWKKFISGVTQEQLDECYYEFGIRVSNRGHGGLINWLEHIFKK